MKLLYEIHRDAKPTFTNFGDELNLWIWPQLMGEVLDDCDSTLFVGIGTVLDDTLPVQPLKIVLGAGNGYRPPPKLDDRFQIYCVRGPLTAEVLGLPASKAVTDPAVLVAKLVEQSCNVNRDGVVLIPHHTNCASDWSFACRELGMSYVSPLWPHERVLECIQGAKLVVTEAMHGAIVADALRVPWVPVTSSVSACPFKWNDWTSSVGLKYDPVVLPGIWGNANRAAEGPIRRAKEWIKRRQFVSRLTPPKLAARAQLSADAVIESRISRLMDEVENVKRDAIREGWFRTPDRSPSLRAGL